MNVDLFVFEMKKAGYRTSESRAKVLGMSLSAYYRRTGGECEFTKEEIGKVAEILGKELAWAIFFADEVS